MTIQEKLRLLFLLGISFYVVHCSTHFPAPSFSKQDNLSSKNCGIWSGNANEEPSWRVVIDYNGAVCEGILISNWTVLTSKCMIEKADLKKGNISVHWGVCARSYERQNLPQCSRKQGRVLYVMEKNLDLKIYITNKLSDIDENICPICLFNRGNELDTTGSPDSLYLHWNQYLYYEQYGFDYDTRSIVQVPENRKQALSPRHIVPIENCLNDTKITVDKNGRNLFLCTSPPVGQFNKLYGNFLVNFHKGRYFLRGLNVITFDSDDGFNDRKFNIYLDLLPHSEWIARRALDEMVLTLTSIPKPMKELAIAGKLSFPDCGVKSLRQKRDTSSYSESSEEIEDATQLVGNGYNAKPDGHPWHAKIIDLWNNNICGGTLISRKTVLTVAHCIFDCNEDELNVTIGKYDRSQTHVRGMQTKTPSKLVIHPNYTKGELHSDIGLLIFNDGFELTEHVRPICLWNEDTSLDHIDGRLGVVVGYGLDAKRTFPSILQEAKLKIRTHLACYFNGRRFFKKNVKPGENFCAGYRNGTKGCPGDSGGSLSIKKDDRWFIRGAVAFGKTNISIVEGKKEQICLDSFGIFVDIAYYLDWILANTPDLM
ncbi:Hypothetical predicted protein [Cloeon dipterum]|uniref:Peptidase S1 domain-containing protein n=2 Tax=Cloeon dipterum TaxID=197152 RepID=A0A8S1CMZ3_9INSE|nr:Hypothetical predicted protein [Cloeon dipterum]